MMQANDAIHRVFPLADTVQFNLFVVEEPKGTFIIKGHGTVNQTLMVESPGVQMDWMMECVVRASGIGLSHSYIIMQVAEGDLHFLLSYDSIMKELTFCLLDGLPECAKKPGALNSKTLKEVYDLCLQRVRAMWLRVETNSHWSRLDAPEDLDDPTVEHPAQAGGQSDLVSTDT